MPDVTRLSAEQLIEDAMSMDKSNARNMANQAESIAFYEIQQRWQKLMAMPEFLWYLNNLLERCGALTPEARASGDTNVRLGEKNIGIFIIENIMTYSPGMLEGVLRFGQLLPSTLVGSGVTHGAVTSKAK